MIKKINGCLNSALRNCIFIFSFILVYLGLALFTFRDPLINYLASTPIIFPAIISLLEKMHSYPLSYYTQDAYSLFATFSIFLMKIGLLLAVGVVTKIPLQFILKIWRQLLYPEDRWQTFSVLLTLILLFYTTAMLTTPQINFGYGRSGSGYGHDGMHYGKIADSFTPFKTPVHTPFCYRIFPSILVFYSGMQTFQGFHMINFISYVLSCILMYRLLRFFQLDTYFAVLGVLLLIALKFGVKYWIYYPVLNDGTGTLLLLSVLYFTLSQNHLLYLLTMIIAVFCRENLLALILFQILYTLSRSPHVKTLILMTMLNLIPIIVFIINRHFPLVLPITETPYLSPFDLAEDFLLNTERKLRFVLGHIKSLGILCIFPFFAIRETCQFLGRHPYWIYYLLINLVMSAVGGEDVERYALWQAPLLIIILLRTLSLKFSFDLGSKMLIHFVLLQLIWSEIFFYWRSDEAFYFSRYVAYANGMQTLLMTISCLMYVILIKIAYKRYLSEATIHPQHS